MEVNHYYHHINSFKVSAPSISLVWKFDMQQTVSKCNNATSYPMCYNMRRVIAEWMMVNHDIRAWKASL